PAWAVASEPTITKSALSASTAARTSTSASCSATTSRSGSRSTVSRTISRRSGDMSMSTILVRSKRLPFEGVPRVSARAAPPPTERRIGLRSGRRPGSRPLGGLDPVELAARAGGGHRLGPPADAKLLEDVVHVVLHGRKLDPKPRRDLLVREPLADQREDLA